MFWHLTGSGLDSKNWFLPFCNPHALHQYTMNVGLEVENQKLSDCSYKC